MKVLASLATLLALSGTAFAQDWPARPSICRTAAPRLFDWNVSNRPVAGSKRRIALATKSVTHTLSFSST